MHQFTARFTREADAVFTGLGRVTRPTGSTTSVRATFLAVTIRLADDLAKTIFAGVVLRAGSALASATVGSTLLARAIGLTASSALVAVLHADGIPLHFTAERIHIANTGFALASSTTGEGSRIASVGAFAAIDGAVVAVFAFVYFAETVATNRCQNTLVKCGTLFFGTAEPTKPSTGVRSALFTYTLWLTDVDALAIVTFVTWLTNAALSATSVGTALLVCAVGNADWKTLPGRTFLAIGAGATGAAALVGAALVAATVRCA